MRKRFFWLAVYGLMALSLVMAACGPTETPATPTTPTSPTTPTTPIAPTTPTTPTETPTQKEAVSSGVPKYGGTLNLMRDDDVTSFDPTVNTGQTAGNDGQDLVNEPLWIGDWAKGAAGGYGTNEVSFIEDGDVWDYKAGNIAETTKWSVDWDKNEGTIVYKIRQGIHWALDPNSEASRMVGGRQLTADDVVAHLTRMITDGNAYVYRAQPEMRVAQITKTGPWEVTVKLPVNALVTAITRFGQAKLSPPEVIQKYGHTRDWKTDVGSGAFMVTDYVPGSQIVYSRNPDYWMTDPIGPGKGNQLPYLNSVRFLIIPDKSTQQAALRTGKLDQVRGDTFSVEDAAMLRQQAPGLIIIAAGADSAPSTAIRIDREPFTDVRVRRAMFMAINFQAILNNLYSGENPQIITWPYEYNPAYANLYMGLDDSDIPESVKELYTYNPDKAKQLLAEAGYPDGFKTEVLTTAPNVDYYSVLKSMWAQVGIDLTINVQETGTFNNIRLNREQKALVTGTRNPVAIFYAATHFSDAAAQNASQVNDPYINETITKMRRTILEDGMKAGMKVWREMLPYIYDQAYHIPGVRSAGYRYWWPWVKNYSGEYMVGYYTFNWPQWAWIDQQLKKSMGY